MSNELMCNGFIIMCAMCRRVNHLLHDPDANAFIQRELGLSFTSELPRFYTFTIPFDLLRLYDIYYLWKKKKKKIVVCVGVGLPVWCISLHWRNWPFSVMRNACCKRLASGSIFDLSTTYTCILLWFIVALEPSHFFAALVNARYAIYSFERKKKKKEKQHMYAFKQ